jgi:hypothetical protein
MEVTRKPWRYSLPVKIIVLLGGFFFLSLWFHTFIFSSVWKISGKVISIERPSDLLWRVDYEFNARGEKISRYNVLNPELLPDIAVGDTVTVFYNPQTQMSFLTPPVTQNHTPLIMFSVFGVFTLYRLWKTTYVYSPSSTDFDKDGESPHKNITDAADTVSRDFGVYPNSGQVEPNPSDKRPLQEWFMYSFTSDCGFYYEGPNYRPIWSVWEGALRLTNTHTHPVRILAAFYFSGNGHGVFSTLPLKKDVFSWLKEPLEGYIGEVDKNGWIKPSGVIENQRLRIPYYSIFSSLRLSFVCLDTENQVSLFHVDFPQSEPEERVSMGLAPYEILSKDRLYTSSTVHATDFYDGTSPSLPQSLVENSPYSLDYIQGQILLSYKEYPSDLKSPKNLFGPYFTIGFGYPKSPYTVSLQNASSNNLKIVWFDIFCKSRDSWVACNSQGRVMLSKEFSRLFQAPEFIPINSKYSMDFNWMGTLLSDPSEFKWAFVAVDNFGTLHYGETTLHLNSIPLQEGSSVKL